MEWAPTLALILSSIGGAVIGPKLVGKIWNAITGRSTRRRTEADQLRDELTRTRDHLRIVEESLWVHRRIIAQAACLDEDDLPAYPTWSDKQ